jgi:HIT zinc finger
VLRLEDQRDPTERLLCVNPAFNLCSLLPTLLQTEKKSRAGTSSSGMTGAGKKGGAGAGGSAASSAAAMKKFSEKRARITTFAETVASELGLGMEAADASTGAFDLAKARAIAVAAKRGERKLKAAVPPAASSSSSSSSASDSAAAGSGASIPGSQAYLLTAAGPSIYPGRPHCSVCGMKGPYSCTRCGSRFCSARCGAQHKETRCLLSGGGS